MRFAIIFGFALFLSGFPWLNKADSAWDDCGELVLLPAEGVLPTGSPAILDCWTTNSVFGDPYQKVYTFRAGMDTLAFVTKYLHAGGTIPLQYTGIMRCGESEFFKRCKHEWTVTPVPPGIYLLIVFLYPSPTSLGRFDWASKVGEVSFGYPDPGNTRPNCFTIFQPSGTSDVSPLKVVSPVDSTPANLPNEISLQLINFSGDESDPFDVSVDIGLGDTLEFSEAYPVISPLSPQETVIVTLWDEWTPAFSDTLYWMRVVTHLYGDSNPHNDTLFTTVATFDTINTGVEGEGRKWFTSRPLLEQNFPNPFSSTTTISYTLPEGRDSSYRVSLSVYNFVGELVSTLVEGREKSGWHQVKWDGKDREGKKVKSGIYFYQLKFGGYLRVKKMILF